MPLKFIEENPGFYVLLLKFRAMVKSMNDYFFYFLQCSEAYFKRNIWTTTFSCWDLSSKLHHYGQPNPFIREISKLALVLIHVYYSIKHVYSTKCMYSFRCFLWSFGTVASSAGYPIGNSINNFSFAGLPNRVLNLVPKFING